MGLTAALMIVCSQSAAYADGAVDLAITTTAPTAEVVLEDTVTLTATITNGSDVVAESVTASIDSNARIVSMQSDTPGSCDVDRWIPRCFWVDVAPGATVIMRIGVRGVVVGLTDIDVVLHSATTDSNDANNRARVSVQTLAKPVLAGALTLSTSAQEVASQQPVVLRAVLTAGGGQRADEAVTLQTRSLDGAVSDIGTVRTDSSGAAEWVVKPTASATYQAIFAGSDITTAVRSTEVMVRAGSDFALAVAASPVAVPPGGALVLSGKVRPAIPGTVVRVEQRFGAGPWTPLRSVRVGAGGSIQANLGTRSQVGSYAFRLTHPQVANRRAVAVTTTAQVTVRGAGNANTWLPSNGTRARPVRWNPCKPITYYVNPRLMPRFGLADTHEAIRRVSQASGLTFRYGGASRVVPTARGYMLTTVPDQSIVVAWVGDAEYYRGMPAFAGGAAGVGSNVYRQNRYFRGTVAILHSFSRDAIGGFGSGDTTPHGAVMMHELGHVVGLDHPEEDPRLAAAERGRSQTQIMTQGGVLPAAIWGAGDLAGLKKLGRASGCLP